MSLGRFDLTNTEHNKVKEAMVEFCIHCLMDEKCGESGAKNIVTEGELAILPQVLEALLR